MSIPLSAFRKPEKAETPAPSFLLHCDFFSFLFCFDLFLSCAKIQESDSSMGHGKTGLSSFFIDGVNSEETGETMSWERAQAGGIFLTEIFPHSF
jgi:hypothetical protein